MVRSEELIPYKSENITKIAKRFNQLMQAVDNYQFELLKMALKELQIIVGFTIEYFEYKGDKEVVNEILADIDGVFETYEKFK